jgi:hypothetical protein
VTDSQRLEFLAGQVAALEAFTVALVNSHPNVALLHAEFTRLNELQASASLPTPVSEDYLDGRAATANDLQAHLAAVVAGNKA